MELSGLMVAGAEGLVWAEAKEGMPNACHCCSGSCCIFQGFYLLTLGSTLLLLMLRLLVLALLVCCDHNYGYDTCRRERRHVFLSMGLTLGSFGSKCARTDSTQPNWHSMCPTRAHSTIPWSQTALRVRYDIHASTPYLSQHPYTNIRSA